MIKFLDVPAFSITESWYKNLPEGRKCKQGNRYFVWFFNPKMEGPMWHPVTLTPNVQSVTIQQVQVIK